MHDDVISDIITLQDDVTLQLAKMMSETMTCGECSAFEGVSLTHLHKNAKNSVKSLV